MSGPLYILLSDLPSALGLNSLCELYYFDQLSGTPKAKDLHQQQSPGGEDPSFSVFRIRSQTANQLATVDRYCILAAVCAI
jgi:hypothetical protein